MIDFRSLEVFIWVAKLRNFREAAEKLNTTQPAVTARIKQLEAALGVDLLEPDRKHLSPKGQELLVHAERLIDMCNKTIKAVGGPAVRGMVRLGVSESIVHTWLPALLARVNAAYPNLGLEIDVNISPWLRDRLVTQDLDLAFLVGPIDHPNVHSRPLCSLPMAFMASDRIMFPNDPVGLDEIVPKSLITFGRNTKPHSDLQKLVERRGLRATIHASASLEAVVRFALDGRAVAVIPPAIIANKADVRDRLRRLNTRVELPPLDFFVSWPDALVHPAAQKVAEIAIEVAAQMS
jgi:DNA-binding transcriptional LysR family regulator